MADVSKYLADILAAIYGEEVRQSIHDAIQAMNVESSQAIKDSSDAKSSAKAYAQQAGTSAATATEKASAAATSAGAAKVSETNAKESETKSKASETAAKTSETNAAASAEEAARQAGVATEHGSDAVERSLAAAETANAALEKVESAQTQAAAALVEASNAAGDAGEAKDAVDGLQRLMGGINEDLSGKVDGAYVENGYLYLTSGEEIVAGPLGPFSGSGGGGGPVSGYLVSLKNLLPSRVITAPGGSVVELSFQYTSADEDGNDDGPGIGSLIVNGIKAATLSIPQGNHSIDISPYLVPGSNTVRLKVENSEGLSRTLSYTVSLITLSLTTPFDPMGIYKSAAVFTYTVTGSGTKTVHFLMDGVEIGSEEVSSSGRSRSYAIPMQSAGAHILSVYAELTTGGMAVRSNTLTIGMLWVSGVMSGCSVLSTFALVETVHGDIIRIPYMVYDPLNESASVELSILNPDGSVYNVQHLTVDRTSHDWLVQNYPVGAVKFRIACGSAAFEHTVNIKEGSSIIEPVTDALALYFDPTGRSNFEDEPGTWTDGSVSAEFSDISFSGADGWLTDTDGASILRILPGGSMKIPFSLFASDARTTGVTVEVEMATHNVRDYDTVVMSCLSGGRGFKIASQYAEIASEQSRLSMQFKEDEKVRVSFVVEPRNLHRLIYVFVDGILCGAIQYPDNDNFAQNPAAGLTVGAEASGIDVYRIRLYTKGLSRGEVLDNYIADRPLLTERVDAIVRNDIFDLADDIVISKLPSTLPYMVITCRELPQYKGDKKTCQIDFVNPSDTARSFTAEGVQINVQGTSSAGYKKKNFKFTLKNGLTYTASGETSESYLLREGSVPAKVFCMKADVASSEGANNVELVRLYNDTVPYKTPPQQTDERVRVGIDGLPCVIFWQNPETKSIRFWGKYNFNFDKGAEEVFGLTPGCESWEICNNTSNRVIFKSADFTGNGWQDDFEARYPEDSTDCTNLAAMCTWVVSTDRDAVSSEEEKAARLQKFKDEFEDHFVKSPMLFYYLFTEVFLMVDSRAKNFFPTTFDGTHWLPFPYDFDTAVGINNEGQLVFDYDLEDTDTVDGDNVFNGQDSVLWKNVRDAFGDEIQAMYKTLRSGAIFNYTEVVRRYAEHQAVWPEAVWNEDAWEKYLEPMENDNDSSYLAMLQGSKASQREWWLYNGFRYRDSKYQCGEAESNFITLRCYNTGDITVTPYSHIFPRIKYGSYVVTARGKRNVPMTLACPLDVMNDTEVYIYSADRLSEIGDLSGLQVGYANFSMAVKLQALKLGDAAGSYQNSRLTELYVGNNELLNSLDVQNCVNLAQTVDLSGCVGLEHVKAKGSAVTGFTFPVGGKLRILELPNTVTNLTLRELSQFETLDIAGYDSLTTLWIENTRNVPFEEIISTAGNLDRVRLIGVEWTATSETTLQAAITKLKGCIGLDASGNNADAAVVTGRVHVPSVSDTLLAEINDAFPQLVVVANGVPQYIVRYLNWDGSLLYRTVIQEGSNVVNPVTAGLISAPVRPNDEDTGYAFKDFGTLSTNVHSNVSVVAQYIGTFRVRFMDMDGTVYKTQWVESGESAQAPSNPSKPSTAQYTYEFAGWEGSYTNVIRPTDVVAKFVETVRLYTVKFYNGLNVLQTSQVPYGATVVYEGETPVDPTGGEAAFEKWSPSSAVIRGDTYFLAWFEGFDEYAHLWYTAVKGTNYLQLRSQTNGFDCTIFWGDGTSTVAPVNGDLVEHNYKNAGDYHISIKGNSFAGFGKHGSMTDYNVRIVYSMGRWANDTMTDVRYNFRDYNKLMLVSEDLFKHNTGLSDFSGLFQGCKSLITIPENLFQHNTKVTKFEYCFYNCESLTAIPENLFKNNTQATSFRNCFLLQSNYTSRLTEIPENLFRYNMLATDFSSCFSGRKGITTISEDLFRYNTLATDFSSCFGYCSDLTSIPEGLFQHNTAVTNFNSCFQGCSALTSIPEGLFQHNTAVTNFNSCFGGCIKMTLRKDIFGDDYANRFVGKIVDFSFFCKRTSFDGDPGEAPELWKFTCGSVTSTECFGGAGNNEQSLKNYADIPSGWK